MQLQIFACILIIGVLGFSTSALSSDQSMNASGLDLAVRVTAKEAARHTIHRRGKEPPLFTSSTSKRKQSSSSPERRPATRRRLRSTSTSKDSTTKQMPRHTISRNEATGAQRPFSQPLGNSYRGYSPSEPSGMRSPIQFRQGHAVGPDANTNAIVRSRQHSTDASPEAVTRSGSINTSESISTSAQTGSSDRSISSESGSQASQKDEAIRSIPPTIAERRLAEQHANEMAQRKAREILGLGHTGSQIKSKSHREG